MIDDTMFVPHPGSFSTPESGPPQTEPTGHAETRLRPRSYLRPESGPSRPGPRPLAPDAPAFRGSEIVFGPDLEPVEVSGTSDRALSETELRRRLAVELARAGRIAEVADGEHGLVRQMLEEEADKIPRMSGDRRLIEAARRLADRAEALGQWAVIRDAFRNVCTVCAALADPTSLPPGRRGCSPDSRLALESEDLRLRLKVALTYARGERTRLEAAIPGEMTELYELDEGMALIPGEITALRDLAEDHARREAGGRRGR
jgi:hypothetical protein